MAKGKKPPTPNVGPGASQSAEQVLAALIDQLDVLRVEMRKIGKLDCAATLDEAFARCLQAYVEEREGHPIDRPSRRPSLPRTPD